MHCSFKMWKPIGCITQGLRKKKIGTIKLRQFHDSKETIYKGAGWVFFLRFKIFFKIFFDVDCF